MLTQQAVQERLDAIADEISRSPGMYYELYARLFSQRVKSWIDAAPGDEARTIEHIAQYDPDYSADVEFSDLDPVVARASARRLFNPAWDMEYT